MRERCAYHKRNPLREELGVAIYSGRGFDEVVRVFVSVSGARVEPVRLRHSVAVEAFERPGGNSPKTSQRADALTQEHPNPER